MMEITQGVAGAGSTLIVSGHTGVAVSALVWLECSPLWDELEGFVLGLVAAGSYLAMTWVQSLCLSASLSQEEGGIW